MKSLTAVSAVLPLLLLASGCSKDRNEPRGNGTLNIRLEMDDRIDLVATQACNTKAAPDLGAFTLEVTQGETVVHKIPTLGANTSPSLTLEAGRLYRQRLFAAVRRTGFRHAGLRRVPTADDHGRGDEGRRTGVYANQCRCEKSTIRTISRRSTPLTPPALRTVPARSIFRAATPAVPDTSPPGTWI